MVTGIYHQPESYPGTDIERRQRYAEHIRRQRIFQQDVHWSGPTAASRSCLTIFVPNDDTQTLEPLTCSID